MSSEVFRVPHLDRLKPGQITLGLPLLDGDIRLLYVESDFQKERIKVEVAHEGDERCVKIARDPDGAGHIQIRRDEKVALVEPVDELVILRDICRNWTIFPPAEVADHWLMDAFLGAVGEHGMKKQNGIEIRKIRGFSV